MHICVAFNHDFKVIYKRLSVVSEAQLGSYVYHLTTDVQVHH